MKHCPNCGKEISDSEALCFQCSKRQKAEQEVKMDDRQKKLYVAVSAVSILSLFFSWMKTNFYGLGQVLPIKDLSLSPFSLVWKVQKFQNTYGAVMTEQYDHVATVVLLCFVALVLLHVGTIYFTVKEKSPAYMTGMIAHLTMLAFSSAVLYWGGKMEEMTAGVLYVAGGTNIAVAASVLGLALFVWLFGKKIGSVPDALGHLAAAGIAMSVLFAACLKYAGLL